MIRLLLPRSLLIPIDRSLLWLHPWWLSIEQGPMTLDQDIFLFDRFDSESQPTCDVHNVRRDRIAYC